MYTAYKSDQISCFLYKKLTESCNYNVHC